MLAQEAIETVKNRIDTLKEIKKLLEGISYATEKLIIENEIEALKIILESAKLLHELKFSKSGNKNYIEGYVPNSLLGLIGIEVQHEP